MIASNYSMCGEENQVLGRCSTEEEVGYTSGRNPGLPSDHMSKPCNPYEIRSCEVGFFSGTSENISLLRHIGTHTPQHTHSA